MEIHAEETPCQCYLCGKTFVQIIVLNDHMLTHTGEKSHQCNQCDKALTLNCNLKTHMRVHTGEQPYECNQCDKAFTQCASLKKTYVDTCRKNIFSHYICRYIKLFVY